MNYALRVRQRSQKEPILPTASFCQFQNSSTALSPTERFSEPVSRLRRHALNWRPRPRPSFCPTLMNRSFAL